MWCFAKDPTFASGNVVVIWSIRLRTGQALIVTRQLREASRHVNARHHFRAWPFGMLFGTALICLLLACLSQTRRLAIDLSTFEDLRPQALPAEVRETFAEARRRASWRTVVVKDGFVAVMYSSGPTCPWDVVCPTAPREGFRSGNLCPIPDSYEWDCEELSALATMAETCWSRLESGGDCLSSQTTDLENWIRDLGSYLLENEQQPLVVSRPLNSEEIRDWSKIVYVFNSSVDSMTLNQAAVMDELLASLDDGGYTFRWREQPTAQLDVRFSLWHVGWALMIVSGIMLGCRVWLLVYRKKSNSCICCGYNLTGNVTGICSECGASFDLRQGQGERDPGCSRDFDAGSMNWKRIVRVLLLTLLLHAIGVGLVVLGVYLKVHLARGT